MRVIASNWTVPEPVQVLILKLHSEVQPYVLQVDSYWGMARVGSLPIAFHNWDVSIVRGQLLYTAGVEHDGVSYIDCATLGIKPEMRHFRVFIF